VGHGVSLQARIHPRKLDREESVRFLQGKHYVQSQAVWQPAESKTDFNAGRAYHPLEKGCGVRMITIALVKAINQQTDPEGGVFEKLPKSEFEFWWHPYCVQSDDRAGQRAAAAS
jgi:hypothetical protein